MLNMIIRPGSSQYHPVSLCHHSISVHIYLDDQVYDNRKPPHYLLPNIPLSSMASMPSEEIMILLEKLQERGELTDRSAATRLIKS